MRRLARRLNAVHSDDRGMALIIVIGIGMVMLALVATALTVAMAGLKKTDTDQDLNGAMDAAYAGIDEYRSRLSTDSSYYTYGDKNAPFSLASGSTKLTLPTGAATNPAFGIGVSGSWATVPQSDPVASFRYEVDNAHYTDTGSIRIRSTGRVGNVTRTIVADLKQSGFIDYLYFTDYEVQDPELTGRDYCLAYAYNGRPAYNNNTGYGCSQISFGDNDRLEGPVHSNDTIAICGATFTSKVTTANPNSPYFVHTSGCSEDDDFQGGAPQQAPAITMPPTNVEMKKETRNDLPSEVPVPGCLYTGPTVITFTDDGKMNVKSPWTVLTNIGATKALSTANPLCGTPGNVSNGLGSPAGATIDTLKANVIYVQNVPVIADDPNYSSTTPAGFVCSNATTGNWTFGSASTTLTQYPVVNEVKPAAYGTTTPAYGCKNGDVFVKGIFKGATTIAAENYIYITGDLTYADATKDILGLVGNNAVWVWNPMKSGNKNLLTDTSRTVNAAILSVAHTFMVQNYDQGSLRGTLTVKGSIAQTFRGPVGTSGATGYTKAYKYDTRFAYLAPPKFLSPVSSVYGVSQFAGVAPAFLASGAVAP